MDLELFHWILAHIDRVLSFVAIIIAVVAIYDVRHLFRTTEDRARTAVLRELSSYCVSMSAFYRACEYVEFNTGELNRDSAGLLFTTFRMQQLLAPKATKEELAALQKATRKQVDDAAQGYKEKLVSSGIGKLKDGEGSSLPNGQLGAPANDFHSGR